MKTTTHSLTILTFNCSDLTKIVCCYIVWQHDVNILVSTDKLTVCLAGLVLK